ncbi:hypothetical protein SGPA1_11513 [Streptomyces misionensis JCM 4497]
MRGDQRRPHPHAGCEGVHRALPHLAEGALRPLGPGGLRRGEVAGHRPARADPAEGAVGDHRERRLPVPAGAGLRRGVLDQGDEGGLRRPAAHGPREAGVRGLDLGRVPEGGRPGRRRGPRPQARQGPGPGPRRRHRPHRRPAALRVARGPGQGEDPGAHRRGPDQAGRVTAPARRTTGAAPGTPGAAPRRVRAPAV